MEISNSLSTKTTDYLDIFVTEDRRPIIDPIKKLRQIAAGTKPVDNLGPQYKYLTGMGLAETISKKSDLS